MGCSAASRLTKEIKATNEEIEQEKKILSNSTQLAQAIEVELNKIRKTAEVLTSHNGKLQQDLLIHKSETGAPVNLSVVESAADEMAQFREWIEMEMTECSRAIASLAKLHGLEEDGTLHQEQERQMQGLQDSDYAIEKLKEFTLWKARQTGSVLDGLMDDRIAWVEFVDEVENEIKAGIDATDRDSGGRIRPQMEDLRGKIVKSQGISQLLPRFRALIDIEKQLNYIRANTTGEADGDSKALITKQAEDIKAMTQRLAGQRKLEDERKDALDKELSLKEVQIRHLENKVKDLSRPSQADNEAKAKDREIERLKLELARESAELQEAEEELRALAKAFEDRTNALKQADEELDRLRET